MIGLGNPSAGDDGVGFAVIDALRGRAPPGVELRCCADPAALVPLLCEGVPTVLVDALRSEGPPGRVLVLGVEALDGGPAPVSSHGLSVPQAVALAGVLGAGLAPVWVVGVTVSGGVRMGVGLSPEVGAAVERAAIEVSILLQIL